MPDPPPALRDEEAVRRFVEHMAMTLEQRGFPRMAGRVLVAMMSAEEDSLSAADLAERLRVSPAAISGSVRYLIQLGLLVREPAPGSRRDRYRMPDDAWYEASVTKEGALQDLADLAGSGIPALGGPGTRSGQRMSQMRDFFLFAEAELEVMLAKWQATKPAGTASAPGAAATGRRTGRRRTP